MKKAILGAGIGWGILCLILALVFFILGAVSTTPEMIQELVNRGMTQAQAQEAAAAATLLFFVTGGWCIVAAAFSFVLLGIRNKGFGKGAGIALGIIGIAVGAELPGILFIIDSAKNRE